jgi:hypothetical protein
MVIDATVSTLQGFDMHWAQPSAQKKDKPLHWSTCSCSARIILDMRSIVALMRAPIDINCKINIHMILTIHCKYDRKKKLTGL